MTDQSHEPEPSNPGRLVRCPYCNTALFRIVGGRATIEVQCRRCKFLSTHHVGGPPPNATNAKLAGDAR